jgi:Flp pilus assembly protein TadG
MSRRGRSRRGTEDGSAAVEAALVLPVLLLFVVGSVELGRALWTYHRMLLAVEEAGRYAMVYGASPSLLTSASCPGVSGTVTLSNCAVARANAYLAAYGATGVTVSPSEDTSSPKNLTITATYAFNFIVPNLLPFGPINLSTQVKVPEL